MSASHPKTNLFDGNKNSDWRSISGRVLQQRLPQLVLIVFLQVMPICKVLSSAHSALPASPAAIILRWAAVIASMAGAYHTVSAASAAIVGLTKYNNNTPVGGPTNNAVALEGGSFRFRITVSNAGSDHAKDYFNCVPIPPGLTINTNLGGTGFITNAPNASLVPGIYPVVLYAGNTSYPKPETYKATITIVGVGSPPVILAQPSDQTVTEGQTVTFNVTASGSAPLAYQWRWNTASIPGETNATLTLPGVAPSSAGTYSVVVSNNLGTAASSNAVLIVQTLAPLRLEHPHFENGSFLFESSASTGFSYVLWGTFDFQVWTPISTNAASGGKVQFSDAISVPGKRFYNVTTVAR